MEKTIELGDKGENPKTKETYAEMVKKDTMVRTRKTYVHYKEGKDSLKMNGRKQWGTDSVISNRSKG